MTFPIDYAKRPRAQRLYHTHSVATAAATARAAILSGEAPGSAARIAAARRSRRRAAAARNSKPFASINCRACERRFTPGPRAIRAKTYPIGEILDAITAYNRGDSLEEVSRRLSSRYGRSISPSTISRWLSAHPHLATYRRLREKGRGCSARRGLCSLAKARQSRDLEI